MGVGMLAGGLAMSTWGGPKKRRIPAVIGFISLAMIGLILAGLRANPVFPAAGLALMVFFIPLASGTSQAVWQTKVSPELQGRVFSVRAMLSRSMMPIAYMIAGPLADLVKVAGSLVVGGGRLLAMTGRNPADTLGAGLKGWKVAAVHPLTVPGLAEERHLVELCRSHDRVG